MSYTINRTNGQILATVADGTVNTSYSLTLIGKNYAGYGDAQNENFVKLLENFANTSQPSNPLAGQLWYKSDEQRLKVYNGGAFTNVSGVEVSPNEPTSTLNEGDFWFNTISNQLFAWNGSDFTLIGPEEVTGAGTTQMRSISVLDTTNNHHAIIQGLSAGNVIFTVSTDAAFQLNNTANPITGFDYIQQGLTLAYTQNANDGVTSNNYRFHGTATNSEKLGGLDASSYIQTNSPNFGTLVNFSDLGYTVGSPIAKLAVFNESATIPTIQNILGSKIIFKTTVTSVAKTPLVLDGNNVTPGVTGVSLLGTSALQWAEVHAGYIYGVAEQADSLTVGGEAFTASIASSPKTVVARDSSQNINANLFNGTATAAQYADLAEKYLADADYEVGTVVMIGGDREVTACQTGVRALGAVSANPAFMMNKDLEGGTYVALKGRVPVKVNGPVVKGQKLVASIDGSAQAAMSGNTDVFAIALETSNEQGAKLVECVIL